MKLKNLNLAMIAAAVLMSVVANLSAHAGLIGDDIIIRTDDVLGLGQQVTVIDPGLEYNALSTEDRQYTIDVFDEHIMVHIFAWPLYVSPFTLSLDFLDLNVGGTLIGVSMVDVLYSTDPSSFWLGSFSINDPVFNDFGDGTSTINITGLAPSACIIGLCIIPDIASFRLNLDIDYGDVDPDPDPDPDPDQVPAPTVLGLLGFGLAGLGIARRRRSTK